MKFSLVIILLLSIVLNIQGQQSDVALQRIWQDQSEKDEVRLAAIQEMSTRKYLHSEADSAILLAQKAFAFAESRGMKKEMALALNVQTIAYASKREFAKAIDLNNQSLNISQSLSDIQLNQIKKERLLLLAGIVILLLGFGLLWRVKQRQVTRTQITLLQKIEELKAKLNTPVLISPLHHPERRMLDKEKIEAAIDAKIGESSWLILNLIFREPAISNKAIAEEVSLSLEGVSSSLRRMYVAFGVKSKSNKKVALATKVAQLSFDK